MAKNVRIYSVRVLDCNGDGTWDGVIGGVDWVTANHLKPAVANMSLGGGAHDAADTAVRNSIAAGITYVVSAGNANQDASGFSPARVTEAITVAATDSADVRYSLSNFGSVVDIFAPGVDVTSAWYTSDTATNTISGTSMAAPHVAGLVAQYLQRYADDSPATVADAVINNATTGVVSDPGPGSPNRLLFSDFLVSLPAELHIAPSIAVPRTEKKIYLNTAYSIQIYGISNAGIDVQYTLNGTPNSLNNVWQVDANGYKVQDVGSGTQTGTYVFTHIRQNGTADWVDIPNVTLEVVSGTAPDLATDIAPKTVLRPSSYVVQIYGAPNSVIDVKYRFNDGAEQTIFGVWTTDQYGSVFQPVGSTTEIGKYTFTQIKRSVDSAWTDIPDIDVNVVVQ